MQIRIMARSQSSLLAVIMKRVVFCFNANVYKGAESRLGFPANLVRGGTKSTIDTTSRWDFFKRVRFVHASAFTTKSSWLKGLLHFFFCFYPIVFQIINVILIKRIKKMKTLVVQSTRSCYWSDSTISPILTASRQFHQSKLLALLTAEWKDIRQLLWLLAH